jgi:hypothetical protein
MARPLLLDGKGLFLVVKGGAFLTEEAMKLGFVTCTLAGFAAGARS